MSFPNKFLKIFLSIIASYYLLVYLIIGAIRLFYPFELEWMEGAVIDHIRRILSGHQLYVKPSIDFVPFIYPPLYYYLSAGLSKIIGIGFLAPRLISYFASVGIFIFIFLLIKKETKNNFAGLLGSALFAATFRISGAWFDIARVDTLFILFVIAAIYFLRHFRQNWKGPVFSALLFTLGYFTKQQALPIALAVGLYYLYENRRQFLSYALIFGLTAGGVTLLLNYLTSGWYGFYILKLPLAHPVISAVYYNFWRYDLWAPLSTFLIIILFFFFKEKSPLGRSQEASQYRFYLLLAGGAVGASFISRLHDGGWDNVLIPGYAVIAVLFGLALHFIFSQWENELKLPVRSVLFFCLLLQFLALLYNPLAQLPAAKDRLANEKFIDKLKFFDNKVLVFSHGYLPTMAGLKTYANWAAVYDILRAKDGFEEKIKAKLVDDIQSKIKKREFHAIILDNDRNITKHFKISPYYQLDSMVFDKKEPNIALPVTGIKYRPTYIYLPNL